jgi:hypothetical protein
MKALCPGMASLADAEKEGKITQNRRNAALFCCDAINWPGPYIQILFVSLLK